MNATLRACVAGTCDRRKLRCDHLPGQPAEIVPAESCRKVLEALLLAAQRPKVDHKPYNQRRRWTIPARKLRAEPAQGLESALDRLDPLWKAEAHLAAARRGIVVEARRGHGRHGGLLDQMPVELGVIFEPERLDSRHHVVGAVRG